MGQVIDLVPAANGTIVHLELLPGAVEDYLAVLERATGPRRITEARIATDPAIMGRLTYVETDRVRQIRTGRVST